MRLSTYTPFGELSTARPLISAHLANVEVQVRAPLSRYMLAGFKPCVEGPVDTLRRFGSSSPRKPHAVVDLRADPARNMKHGPSPPPPPPEPRLESAGFREEEERRRLLARFRSRRLDCTAPPGSPVAVSQQAEYREVPKTPRRAAGGRSDVYRLLSERTGAKTACTANDSRCGCASSRTTLLMHNFIKTFLMKLCHQGIISNDALMALTSN